MRERSLHSLLALALMIQLAGCQDATAPDAELVLTGPPDLTAVVFQSTQESMNSPAGYISQYAVWIGSRGAASPDAGVVIGSPTPVFLRSRGKLTSVTAATIAVGDFIKVWRDASVAYGAVEAPPEMPCYTGTQVVIVR
jgi:hypothetical protein